MMNRHVVDDHSVDLETTPNALDRSTRTHGSNESNTLYSYQTKWKFGKANNIELLLKLFEQRNRWKKYGNLRVLCKGTFILAPLKLWWLMAEAFVLSTVMVFAYEFFFLNWVILVPAVIIAILELMAFYKTCLKDPGVMPRPDFVEALKNLTSVLSTWNGGPGTARIVAHPNGQQEKLQYCWRCHHFRSLHTSHCGTCDSCMIQHDHHCPVFGGCVAKNNVSSFHTMIITMGVFWLYMLGYCIYNIISRTDTDKVHGYGTDGIPLTFYVIMAEIGSVCIIPLTVNCAKEVFCRSREQPQSFKPSKSKETVDDILNFARVNNLTVQEIIQLKEILQVQDSSVEMGRGSQDLNHNNFLLQQAMSQIK